MVWPVFSWIQPQARDRKSVCIFPEARPYKKQPAFFLTGSDQRLQWRLMIGAALLAAATMELFSLFDATTGLVFIIAALALVGIAVGLFMPPIMSLILGSGNREAGGVASGVMMTLRNAGAMLGIAVFGTLAMQMFPGRVAGHSLQVPAPDQLVPGFQAAFLTGVPYRRCYLPGRGCCFCFRSGENGL
jgi:MFS family permease